MIKYLIENKRYFKANLHSHTVISDGKLTALEMKEEYKKRGYSIIAYTDHNVFITHNDLTDDSFLALNGFELDDTYRIDSKAYKTCHICMIAKDKNNDIHPLWHRSKYMFSNCAKYKDLVKFDDSLPDYERTYNKECINEMIKIGKEKGFFVTYNHPTWSFENYSDYGNYVNMDAMEIYNHGSYTEGYQEINHHEYDDLLRQNKRIYTIATDDNHNFYPFDSMKCDSFGGFTMIGSDSLNYSDVIKTLENGNFYASTGPLIKEVYFNSETKEVTVKAINVKRIILTTDRICRGATEYNENSLNEFIAKFIVEDDTLYFRIIVEDDMKNFATTNGYFLEDLLK